MDAANGTLLRAKVDFQLAENSEFFPFAGALMPGKIMYWERGALKMEISQTMTPLENVTPNVLAAPPNAQIRHMCKTFRQPFGQSMPQPKPGNGGTDADVLLRGLIGTDGRVREAVVERSGRADLDDEAVRMLAQWVFTPATCDGQPNQTEASFTLHFQGR